MKNHDIYKEPKKLTKHNHIRTDKYFWMHDIKNKNVIAYLKRENYISEKSLSKSIHIQEKIYKEIISKINIQYESIPFIKNQYSYFYKIKPNKSYPIYYRRKNNKHEQNIKSEIILDINKLIKSNQYGDLSNIQISCCEEYIMYSIDTKGNRKYDLYIYSIKEQSSTLIKRNITSNVIWGRHKNEIFFTCMDKKTLRQDSVFIYNIQKKRKKLLYKENDEECYIYITKSKSKRFLFLISTGKQSIEYQYIDLSKKYIKLISMFTMLHDCFCI